MEGRSYVDESMVTGESKPVTKKAGDSVISGTVNSSGPLVLQVQDSAKHISSSIHPLLHFNGNFPEPSYLGKRHIMVSVALQATRVGAQTTLAQIVRLVERAQMSKAPIQAVADRISSVFVPIILAVALATWLGWFVAGTRPLTTTSDDVLLCALILASENLQQRHCIAWLRGMCLGVDHLLTAESTVQERQGHFPKTGYLLAATSFCLRCCLALQSWS